MTKKEFDKMVEDMNANLEQYRCAEPNSKEQMTFGTEYQRLFKLVEAAKKEQLKLTIENKINIEFLENSSDTLEFTYEKLFKNEYGFWQTTAEGVVIIKRLGGKAYGYSNQGWNCVSGEIDNVDVITRQQVSVKLRSYGLNLKEKNIG